MTAKISISVPDAKLLAWARRRAKAEGSSLSAVFMNAIRLARQQDALDRYLEWAGPVGELTPEREAEIAEQLGDRARKPRKKR